MTNEALFLFPERGHLFEGLGKQKGKGFIRVQYPHPNKDAKNEKEHIKVLHCLHFFKIPEIKGISKPGLVIEFYIISKIC